jgi:hypothetical protein
MSLRLSTGPDDVGGKVGSIYHSNVKGVLICPPLGLQVALVPA